MYDVAILWEWLAFAVRWLHVITAIAWIGSSFYFIALDLGLNRNIQGPADGEEWQVHGGASITSKSTSWPLMRCPTI